MMAASVPAVALCVLIVLPQNLDWCEQGNALIEEELVRVWGVDRRRSVPGVQGRFRSGWTAGRL